MTVLDIADFSSSVPGCAMRVRSGELSGVPCGWTLSTPEKHRVDQDRFGIFPRLDCPIACSARLLSISSGLVFIISDGALTHHIVRSRRFDGSFCSASAEWLAGAEAEQQG